MDALADDFRMGRRRHYVASIVRLSEFAQKKSPAEAGQDRGRCNNAMTG